MRVAPVGMFLARGGGNANDEMTKEAFDIACSLAAITHGHPTGQLAAGVLAAIVALVLNGIPLTEAIEKAKAQLCLRPGHLETLLAIERVQLLAECEPNQPDAMPKLGEGWVAEEALAISLYCALGAEDFEAGVVLAVNHNGDSDSTGAITGHLLGVKFGVEAIPPRWLGSLELRDVIMAMADDLATFPEWDVGEHETSAECAFYRKRYPGG